MLRLFILCWILLIAAPSYSYYQKDFNIPHEIAQIPEDIFLLGKSGIDLRFRNELVQDKSFEAFGVYPRYAGQGLTLSTQLNFQTALFMDTFVNLQFDHVAALLSHHFNSGHNSTPDKIEYAQIPDPKGTALTQAYVGFLGIPDTWILLGRQSILLDNERFVGKEAFRQTPQTFDAITLVNRSLKNVEFMYGYIFQVNSIWQGNPCAEFAFRQNSDHFLNVSSELAPFGTVVGYAYLIDDKALPFNSTSTFGLRYLDDYNLSNVNFYYVAEFATQRQYHNQPIHFNAFYTHFLAGLQGYGVDFKLGQEILSGNKAQAKAFRTPLASKHEFNGAADRFLNTPDLGLIDWYGELLLNYWNTELSVEYHRFDSQRGNASYGHEWDFAITRPFFKYYYLEFSFADFSGRNDFYYADVQKIWMTAGVSFP